MYGVLNAHKVIATTGFHLIDEVIFPTTKPERKEVFFEVKFAAISPLDVYHVYDSFLLQPSNYPYALGVAGAGIVTRVGEGIEDLKAGDRVRLLLLAHRRDDDLL